jgi:tetratricopeptide (TPR) repeat protein
MGKIIPKPHFILIACIIFFYVPASFSQTIDTKQAQFYRDKGYEAQRLGNLDMALSFYQKAVEFNPSYALVYNDIGIVLEAKGNSAQAKEAYLKAVSLDQNCLGAYYNLAALYEKEGDLDKAAYYWKMRVNLGDWSDNWTWKANEHLQSIEAKSGLDTKGAPPTGDLARGAEPNPKRDAQYHLNRGRQYLAAGDYTAALKEFNAAIILDPNNTEIEELLEDAQRRVLLYN